MPKLYFISIRFEASSAGRFDSLPELAVMILSGNIFLDLFVQAISEGLAFIASHRFA